jgi:hypothetical protein
MWMTETALVAEDLLESITVQTLHQNLGDTEKETWFHPKACMIPDRNGSSPLALMTKQVIGGSDYFGPVHWSISNDQGRTWSEATPIPALDRKPVKAHEGLMAGVCDVVPEYHAATDTVGLRPGGVLSWHQVFRK